MAAQSISAAMQIAVSNSYPSIGLCAATRKRFSDHKVMVTGPGSAKTCIVGLGDPVVDVLVKLSAQNFDQLGLQRGGSVSLHASEIDDLLEQVDNDGHRTRLVYLWQAACDLACSCPDGKYFCVILSVHGGSAANVLKGLGNLALQQRSARFMGMVGLDDAGRCNKFLTIWFLQPRYSCNPKQEAALTMLLFSGDRQFYDHFKQQHVDPLLLTSSSGRATATCLCLLTPDGERTMRTHLGASSELIKADQLPNGWTNNCRLLHCEGYCLYKLDLTRGAMQAAKHSGAEVHTMARHW